MREYKVQKTSLIINKYFLNVENNINEETIKTVEKFIFDIKNNILNFALNKCVANIYSLFNYLKKIKFTCQKIFSAKNNSLFISNCTSVSNIYLSKSLFSDILSNDWPIIDKSLLEENEIILPIQIKGKLITTIKAAKDYKEEEILKDIYQIDKVKMKINEKKF